MNARRVLEAVWIVLVALVPSLHAVEQHDDAPPSAPAVRDEALRRELLNMTEEDQKVRVEMIQELAKAGVTVGAHVDANNPRYVAVMKKESARLSTIDTKNRQRLKEIVEQHGWPGMSLVGKDGQQAAWLLVQHSDADRDFQKTCLQLMEAMPAGEVQQQSIAFLTDRILVGEKKPQRYGTQMDNEFNPAPLEDPKNVDKRRAEVGLPPLAEYVKTSKEMYEQMSRGSSDTGKPR